MKTSSVWGIILVLVLIIGGIWVVNKTPSSAPAGNDEVIKIGAIYAMTGSGAKFGEISIQGVRDAVEYFKETTKQSAEVIVEDSAGDPKQGVSAAGKLLNVDKVKFVVIGTSAVSAAVAPLAEEAKVLLISDAALLGLTKEKNYTLQNAMPSLADIPEQINNNTDWKKVGIVYINDEFGNVWQENILAGLNKEKIAQAFSFEKTITEYRIDAAKIKQFMPDALVVIGYGPAFNQVLADLALMDISAPIISYLACTLPGVLADTRFSLEGQYSYEYPSISNEAVRTWIVGHGRDMSTFYTAAFENTLLSLIAAQESGGNVDSAINYLKTAEINGLWGKVKFGQDGVVNRNLVVTKVQNGVCVPTKAD